MILYPHLLKPLYLKDLKETQPFWINILERLSIGDCPFGTSLKQHNLIYRQHTLSIEHSTPQHIIEFYKEIVGLNIQYVFFTSWKDIKRKVIRDNLIQDYIKRTQIEWELSQEKTNQLSSCIHLFLTLKKIVPDDICIEYKTNTYIQNIDGFIFKKGDFVFSK